MRALAALLIGLCACASEDPAAPRDATLDGWDLFESTSVPLAPRDGVVPYEVISALWMDFAEKHRFIVLPEGGTIGWEDGAKWRMPLGTILVKSFGYRADLRDPASPERMLETRLLVLEETGWEPYVYVWNDAQDATERAVAGARVDVSWIDAAGEPRSLLYRVPNVNQCEGCHGGTGEVELLGVRTRQLDRDHDYGAAGGVMNQIDFMQARGMFDRAPPPAAERVRMADPAGTDAIGERARSYLDANCAHCHREGGLGGRTGLWLAWDEEDGYRRGVCRRPVAAGGGTGGRLFDVVPGRPDESIMTFRMESEDPGIKMPELPSQLSDATGVTIVREWIASLPDTGCEM